MGSTENAGFNAEVEPNLGLDFRCGGPSPRRNDTIDVKKRSIKNVKKLKNVKKREKNLKKTFVNVITNVTSS